MLKRCLLLAAITTSLTACATSPSPIPPGTQTAAYGNLVSGAKFGTAIGRPSAEAQAALWEEGYGFEGKVNCSDATRALFSCRDGDTFLKFQPVALDRKGAVYLKIDGGQISEIGWDLTNAPKLEG